MDQIAAMFVQINNAIETDKEKILISFSKMKMAILAILKNSGKIADFKEIKDKNHQIEVRLSRNQHWKINRVSCSSRRVYVTFGKIPRPKSFRGIIIISTPEGLMLGEEARQKGVGGELIAEVH